MSEVSKCLDARLLRAADTLKDQTFFLCHIKQEALRRTMFPVGNSLKSDVKRIAKEIGLHKIGAKRESRGICFIGKRKFQNFIDEYIEQKKGDFVDIETGKVVGKHNGIHQFVVGQCVRLVDPVKQFAVRKLKDSNMILVAHGRDNPLQYSDLFYTNHPHWIRSSPLLGCPVLDCLFRFQHTHPLRKCRLCRTEDGLLALLDEPVRAIRMGQIAAFYSGDECLGGARIKASGPMIL